MHASKFAAAVLAILVSGCVVQIDDKSTTGADPCDPNPCEKQGVCTDWTATCTAKDGAAVCSGWKPTGGGSGDKPAAYEAEETLCDGLDNDCDGLTDESPKADLATACPTVGVCTGQAASATCVAGAWQCTFATATDWQASETLCDGKDNDCDGETDEDAVAGPKDCKRVGVCSGLSAPTCTQGAWDCHYDKAADYEATEQSCDGKDNDCDGVADANLSLSALPGGAKCASDGVCSGGVSVVCKGGIAACDYASVSGYETVEGTCDGKDNDCDGQIDNLQGTSQPLRDSETKDCAKVGVCKAASSEQVSRACSNGTWACDYGQVPYYEAKETLCDGRDNDCDGKADNGLAAPATSPCGAKGVCSGGTPLCSDGIWTCDWASLAKSGYEAFEQTCDGKDNDCDGQTDETPSPIGCKAKGVCAHGVALTCTEGKGTCDYSFVLAYEATETLCDGKDNDCDGVTDEPADLNVADSGCAKGVCQGAAQATCSGGKWQCSFSGVAGYESEEITCDGKDNDCDGQTDEGLNSAAACKTLGVCKGAAVAQCTGGKYLCTYTSPDFQSAETACDGKDNDCDGQTDTGLCAAGKACTANAQCTDGSCSDVLGGTGKVCTAKANQCARRESNGSVSYVDNGTVTCADSGSTLTCSNGAFGSAKACPKSAPACVDGACQLCVPNEKRCDAAKPGDVVQCSADGKSQTKLETCATGKCTGAGVCVVKGAVDVSQASVSGSMPAVAPLSGGGFVVTWIAAKPLNNIVVARVYKSDGTALGAEVNVSDKQIPGASRPAVAALGTGFAVAWTTDAKSSDVVLRRFDAAGKALAAEQIMGKTTTGVQRSPALATLSSGLAVVWESESVDVQGTGVVMQRFDSAGKAVGDEVLVNKNADAQATSESGDEGDPNVVVLSGGDLLVSWVQVVQGNGAIAVRRFSSAGVAKGAPVAVTAGQPSASQTRLSVSASGQAQLVWRQFNGGSAGADVMHVRLDSAFKPVGQPSVVHATTEGEQSGPAIALNGEGRAVLVWQSYDKSNGYDLRVRDLLPTGSWNGTDALLVSPATGEQDQAGVVAFSDDRVLFVWRARTSDVAKGVIRVEFR